MPAYARPGELLVIFQRTGMPPDDQVARDGIDAMKVALAMLHARFTLQPGDLLVVRLVEGSAGLPEASRASHYS
jgi:hypothetical protein